MKSKKFLTAVIVITSLCLICITSLLAYDGYKTIKVHYQNIKIYINGKPSSPEIEPFTFNDRTMVPLRYIAESLNKEVTWDDSLKTIEINDKFTPSTFPLVFKGSDNQATELFSLKPGLVKFEYKYTHPEDGDFLDLRNFIIDLLEGEGKRISNIVNEVGTTNGSIAIKIDEQGQYLLNIIAGKGLWEVIIKQN